MGGGDLPEGGRRGEKGKELGITRGLAHTNSFRLKCSLLAVCIMFLSSSGCYDHRICKQLEQSQQQQWQWPHHGPGRKQVRQRE